MSFREKREAIAAAFVDRVLIGALLGLGLSIPSALITRAYVPILLIGTIGGLAVGLAYELIY